MTCETCGEHHKKNSAKDFTKAVIEINNPETLVLLRKVVIPASMGDDSTIPAEIGKYSNVILVYEANNHVYIYSSDGIPTFLPSSEAQDVEREIQELDNRVTTVEEVASTAIQPADINRVVMTDIALDANTSTTTLQLNESKVNLASGTTSSDNVVFPVASTTQAGVINSSIYDSITSNTNNINALLNGSVAVTGLGASPTQAELTTAWQNETGLTTLINRASIYDVTNSKVWTYYTNDSTWHASSSSSQITINTFTNSSEGTILGSTNVGQIFAENDGTGSVNGWDTLSGAVSTNTSNITTLQNAVTGKQDKLTAGSNIIINAQNEISATDTTYSAGQGLDLTNTTFSIDFNTIFPQTANTEIDTGIKFGGKAVYAQRFTGSSNFTNGTRKEVDLATCSSRPVILQTFGWFTAGDYNVASTTSVPFLMGVSSINGYVVVIGVAADNKIKLRVLPGSTGTYNWDFIVYYFKD